MLMSSGVDNSMAKKKKTLRCFGSLLWKFRLFSTGIEQSWILLFYYYFFIIISLLLLLLL